MATELTRKVLDAASAASTDVYIWDSRVRGFGVKITPTGKKIFLLAYRFPKGRAGKQRRFTIGAYGSVTLKTARDTAEEKRGDIARGIDPMAILEADRKSAEETKKAPKRTVAHIAEEFVERYSKKQNRSWKETDRILKRHVVSAWGKRQISEITRSEVSQLLDQIEDASGSPMATAVLAQLRKMFNWHATRDETFNSPIVKGMARTSPKAMARDRILTDDEIRMLWACLDQTSAPYRQLVRFLLLTAQRREEVAQASHSEISNGVWTIPAERYKTNQVNVVPLSDLAQEQLTELAGKKKRRTFIFTTTETRPFSGFGKSKLRLDKLMEEALRKAADEKTRKQKEPLLKPWRIHDLRRTAKTLMQRAGVRPDVSERVLGHVIPGVAGTYDRHDYLEEKRAALKTLAAEIDRILKTNRAPSTQ